MKKQLRFSEVLGTEQIRCVYGWQHYILHFSCTDFRSFGQTYIREALGSSLAFIRAHQRSIFSFSPNVWTRGFQRKELSPLYYHLLPRLIRIIVLNLLSYHDQWQPEVTDIFKRKYRKCLINFGQISPTTFESGFLQAIYSIESRFRFS